MPNYVMNIVKMKGISDSPLVDIRYDEVLKRDERVVDFNMIIPRPESLNITSGWIEDVAIEAVLRKISEGRFFTSKKNYSKMEDKDFEDAIKNSSKTKEELELLGVQYISNKVMYGHTDWYGWSCQNWGTKWNACESFGYDDDEICFTTAWSCPEPIISKLSEMYPDEIIEHWWADEDMGNNSGYRVYENGKIVEGDYNDSYSTEAYNTYVKCWGESECLYMDKDGNWRRRDCNECDGCS